MTYHILRPTGVLFYATRYAGRHHITAWLREHHYEYHVGGGMVYVDFIQCHKHPRRRKRLFDYIELQAQDVVHIRIYLLEQVFPKNIKEYLGSCLGSP